MKHGPKIWLQDILQDILQSINAVENYVAKADKESFLHSRDLQDKVMWRLTVIGEAVKNLGDAFTDKYPQVPWRKVAAMRNLAVHEYFGIDYETVWLTVTEDLPGFKSQILEILAEQK